MKQSGTNVSGWGSVQCSAGLGGGSVVRWKDGICTVGPDSVGNQLSSRYHTPVCYSVCAMPCFCLVAALLLPCYRLATTLILPRYCRITALLMSLYRSLAGKLGMQCSSVRQLPPFPMPKYSMCTCFCCSNLSALTAVPLCVFIQHQTICQEAITNNSCYVSVVRGSSSSNAEHSCLLLTTELA